MVKKKSRVVAKAKKSEDTYSYRGWMVSDYFWKRLCALMGYTILGKLIIVATLIALTVSYLFMAIVVLSLTAEEKRVYYPEREKTVEYLQQDQEREYLLDF